MMTLITWLTFQNTRLNIDANFCYNFYFNFRHYVTKRTKNVIFANVSVFFLHMRSVITPKCSA